MRMMLKVIMDVDAGNEALKSGMLPRVIQEFQEKHKPEAMYFGLEDGKRTAFAVFDLADPSELPAIAEPLFMHLKARLEMMPVMNAADLKVGVEKAMNQMAATV